MTQEKLHITPVNLKQARLVVERWHRHHKAPQGGLFAIGCADNTGILRGVVVVGRPVSRHLDDGYTVEVTRLCCDGARNAPSLLLGAAWKTAKALGYWRIVTYTLPNESGASLRGAGWHRDGDCGGGSWSRQDRPRHDKHPIISKVRWSVTRNGTPPPRNVAQVDQAESAVQTNLPFVVTT